MNQRDFTLWGGGFKSISSHTFEEITSLENLFLAWHEFITGKRKRSDVQEFECTLEDNLFQLHQDLLNKTYTHGPYHAFYVTDPKLRHIHKATVRDRVLHHAIFRVLYSLFDPTFIHDSYSCRLNKGTHRAVDRLELFARKVSRNNRENFFALKCDIRKFFDSIDQSVLFDLMKKKISDPDAYWLLEKILFSFEKTQGKGLPLGNVTSQLFANVYMNELDQFMKHTLRAHYYMRYCDDFLILHSDQTQLLTWLENIQNFLKEKLRLELHPNKISIRKYNQGIDFLGYVVRPYCRTLRARTKKRILRVVQRGISEQSLQSYLGVLSHCKSFKLRQNLTDIAKSKLL